MWPYEYKVVLCIIKLKKNWNNISMLGDMKWASLQNIPDMEKY